MIAAHLTRYGKPALLMTVAGIALCLQDYLVLPIGFVLGIDPAGPTRLLWTIFSMAAAWLAASWVRNQIKSGPTADAGRSPPPLLADTAGILVMLAGALYVLTAIYGRDVTTLLATGGVGLAILGVALKDVILAAFTGVILNLERPFKVGDRIRVDDHVGIVLEMRWRTTTIYTLKRQRISLPNVMLANAMILNFDEPDRRWKLQLDVVIDYDTSVESAKRVLLSAAMSAEGVVLAEPPTVWAMEMTRDGVRYVVSVIIADHRLFESATDAIIASILLRMRNASISMASSKHEVTTPSRRTQIADRSPDAYRVVSQCKLFQHLPEEARRRIAGALVARHVPAGHTIVSAGERCPSLFIVGEGLVTRSRVHFDANDYLHERIVASECFGRGPLFSGQPHTATATAGTDTLIYELTSNALSEILIQDRELVRRLAIGLAKDRRQRSGRQSDASGENHVALQLQIDRYVGQILATYGPLESNTPAVRQTDRAA